MVTARSNEAFVKIKKHQLIQNISSKTYSTMVSIKDLVRTVLRIPPKSWLLGSGFMFLGVALPRLLQKLSRRFSNVFNGVPGPVVPRLTGCWKQLHLYRGTYLTELAQLHDKNGLIVQVGPSEYSVSDISAIPFWWRLEKV
jgi:hypothetical protein